MNGHITGSGTSGVLRAHMGTLTRFFFQMRKYGAIILGIGGDNSHGGVGTFYEGAMTRGYSSDAADAAVQANIAAAGYGH